MSFGRSEFQAGVKPQARRRLELYPRIRWCLDCRRLTDGTYAIPSGNLCGPGCFAKCETVDQIRTEMEADMKGGRCSAVDPEAARAYVDRTRTGAIDRSAGDVAVVAVLVDRLLDAVHRMTQIPAAGSDTVRAYCTVLLDVGWKGANPEGFRDTIGKIQFFAASGGVADAAIAAKHLGNTVHGRDWWDGDGRA